MTLVWLVAGAIAVAFVGTAVFERYAPPRLVRLYQKYLGNPIFRPSAGFVPGWAVVETVGRRTALPRRVPVGGRLRAGSYWIIVGNARHSQYVRNIEAHPRVRVRIHGRWRSGTAHALHDADARRYLFRLNPVNGLFLWIAGTDLLTIRIDLDELK